jgi:hypothetical protein
MRNLCGFSVIKLERTEGTTGRTYPGVNKREALKRIKE